MPSPLFNLLGGNTPLGNMQNMMSQFNQFKQMFSVDPKQTVQQMLQNGKMSKAQFDQYAQMANELRKMIK